ncbi:MAG: MATE family efflux transporter, partial [Clostridia bacterium]|nr:MATE family efflux transporter [Clostridia bacterium]
MIQNKRFSDKDILKLLIPLLLEQILSFLVGIADTVMVSSAGEAAVSAVSLTDAINILIVFLISAMSSGGAIVYAQSIGRGDEEYAKNAISQLLLTVTAISTMVCILFLIGQNFILNLLYSKVEPIVMENCRIYFKITVLSYPFIGIFNALSSLNRSKGNSAVGLRASVIMNIINVTGNAVLIFGFKMGVAGVAIPTLVSRIASA